MGTLYECLREARLEKYYAAFRANGIMHSQELAHVTMAEFAAMGISGTEDRRRLTDLVNIIKTVSRSRSNSGNSSTSLLHRRLASPVSKQILPPQSVVQSNRSSLGNNGSPIEGAAGGNLSYFPAEGVRLEPTRNVSVRERGPNFSAASYMDMLDMMSDSSHSDASEHHSQSSDGETGSQPSRTINSAPSLSNRMLRKMAAASSEKIHHSRSKGYNYGVPSSKDYVKIKARSSGRVSKVDERIRVCVRKRPQNRREIRSSDEDIVIAESTNTVLVMEPKVAVDLTAFTLKHEFVFDEVFDEHSSNQDVYIHAARPLINTVFHGSNATFFAYGQTGAGKTHTMLGSHESPGLYQLAAEEVFNIITSGQHGPNLHVWVSFFEIYCGQLFDLLNHRNRLVAREDGNHRVCIAGLTETEATDVATLIQILDYGNSVRSKGATGVNPDSSRSHAILQLEIRDADDTRLGKISFIDLAGSERASDMIDTDRQTRLEGAEINQSLLALKECIRSIDQESRHTPFRQSKLTHILKDAFVGNSRTCMIANVSPTQSACEHTLNTLRYADRVKQLKKESPNAMSSSVGQAMNLLMNIPLTAPSFFHPTNVLSTSTPMRPHPSRTSHSNPAADITFDPAETPIRGHHLPLRTIPKASARQQQQGAVGRGPVKSRAKDTWLPRSRMQPEAAASQAPPPPHPEASPSESEQTDTDSCNITHLTEIRPGPSEPNIPVIRSTDTEFEFPTSDFNNIDEQLNDLNQTGDKARSQLSEIHAKPDQDSAACASSSKGELSGNCQEKQIGLQMNPSSETLPSGQTKHASVPSVQAPPDTPTQDSVSDSSLPHSGHQRTPKDATETQAASKEPSKALPLAEHQSTTSQLIDSFDDEMLFGGPLMSGPPQQETARVSGPSVRSEGLWLQRANLQEMGLPAMQTAISSDLTSFAQRSQMRVELERGIRLEPKTGLENDKKYSPRKVDNFSGVPKMPLPKLADVTGSSGISSGNNDKTGSYSVRSQFSPVSCGSPDLASGQRVQQHNQQENISHESYNPPKSPSEEWSDHIEFEKWRTGKTKKDSSAVETTTEIGRNQPVMSVVSTESDTQPQHNTHHKLKRPKGEMSYQKQRAVSDVRGTHSAINVFPCSGTGLQMAKQTSSAVTTEKLLPGGVFSPIHPHPVSTNMAKPGSISVSVVQPKPLTGVLASSAVSGTGSSGAIYTDSEREEARVALVGHHEDQLAAITSLCKQEMKLLLSAKKLGQRSFEEYLHRVGVILAQKMSAINHLQNEIGQYQARFNPSCTSNSVAAAAAAASSIVTTSNVSQHS